MANKTHNPHTLVYNSSSCYEDQVVTSTLQFSAVSLNEYLRGE